MTDKEKVEAIKALLDGRWDDPTLLKFGPLYGNYLQNVERIVYYDQIGTEIRNGVRLPIED